MRDCGGCEYFQKKNFDGNSGICDYHDCRTNSDSGKSVKNSYR